MLSMLPGKPMRKKSVAIAMPHISNVLKIAVFDTVGDGDMVDEVS